MGHLFVRVEGALNSPSAGADVIFLHGNLSSSNFWGDSVLPHLSPEFLSRHRVLLPDLLGLGRSPRPHACLYTIGEGPSPWGYTDGLPLTQKVVFDGLQ